MLLEVRSGICTLQVDNGSHITSSLEDPAGWEPQIRHLLPLPLPSASGMGLPGDAVRLDLDSYPTKIQYGLDVNPNHGINLYSAFTDAAIIKSIPTLLPR